MDEELVGLFARLNDEANPLSDEELADLQSRVAARIAEIRETVEQHPAELSDDDLAQLAEAVDVLAAIGAEAERRETVVAERAGRAAELLAQIPAAEVEIESEAVAEVAETPVPEVVAEPTEAVEVAPEPEPVTAAAPEAPRLPSISRLASRTPRTARPRVPMAASLPTITAAADVPGLSAGQEYDIEEWSAKSMRRIASVMSSTAPGREPIVLGSKRFDYAPERRLGENELANEVLINDVAGRDALMASGGVCAPVAVDYSITTIAQAGRPVRDSLASFAASRGGVRYILPHTLAAVHADGPANLWTEATDASPGNSVKAHATYSCQSVQETFVDAVTSIVQFGNFQARYFPEQVAQYLETVDAEHARLAEATLLKAIYDGSTVVNGGTTTIGAVSEFFPVLDRAVAAYRYRHRMADDAPLRFIYPEWAEDLFRADFARELPGNSGGQSERVAVADAQIDNFFAVRDINVSTYQDAPTGVSPTQGWGVQNAGDLLPWPTTIVGFLYHEGAWMFLDGGELNLGMVRDSTLNKTNDFQMFSETFEKAVFRGHESLAIKFTVCPSGQRASTVDDVAFCATGS